MEIKIPISDEERLAVIKAISGLNDIRHIKVMSQSLIAETAGLKPTKIRLILSDLIEQDMITQYQVSENKRLQRYYYVLTITGHEFSLKEF